MAQEAKGGEEQARPVGGPSQQQPASREIQSRGQPRRGERSESALAIPGFGASPFTFMRRVMEDLDRMFDEFGSATGRAGSGGSELQRWGARGMAWAPSVDVLERDGKLVVRADLPGLSREDVKIEVTEGQLVIEGERRQEREIEKSGMYRAERVYGTFQRVIPLPEHADLDGAEARFENGVLEVSFRLSEEKRRGKRIEITEGKQPSVH